MIKESMKKTILFLFSYLAVAFSLHASSFIPGRVLAKPHPSADKVAVSKSLSSLGAKEVGRVPQIGVLILQVPAKAEARVISALPRNPQFEFAEPDFIAQAILTPNDPYYASYQWHLPKVSAPTA